MPSSEHEALIELLRRRPEFVTELLTDVIDTPLPEFDEARLDSGDLPDIQPTEYRADLVVTLTAATAPVLGIVIEVQLRHDRDKHWSWPVYLTTLRARLRCTVLLVVLCPNERASNRCRMPITVSPGFVLVPLVLSPANVPVVTDVHTAETNPDLAILSAIAHRGHPDHASILNTVAETMHLLPATGEYIDLITSALPTGATRHFLEMLKMTKTGPYMSDYFNKMHFKAEAEGRAKGEAEGRAKGEAEGRAKGEAEGKAEALLTVLGAKRLEVTPALEARVINCTDVDQLDTWIVRAAKYDSIEEVFAD
ncbi:hypothetical protein AW168_17015 [Nocardia brasiliensis]|uniref:Transposase (putative) YhgA-like domain-containing protein n=2 Tax=Nocardia brasiliensis TaxID=37326 RepID=K0EXT9_NOCB7|nr:hypothetical protein O3I_019525 [Nocardia brasiliensis ATCC 700358]OCF89332.1 hypothetical protein AW168_17015 [Nocardia brasiliensis]